MSENTNRNDALRDFARWFRTSVVKPITDNSGPMNEVLRNLGVGTDGHPPLTIPATARQNIDNFCNNETEDSDIEAFLNIIGDIRQVVESAWSFFELLDNSEFEPGELLSFGIQFFMLEDIRRNVKVIYIILSMMEGVDKLGDEASDKGGAISFFWAIGKYFEEFGKAHKLVTKEDAQKLSDFYFMLVPAALVIIAKLSPALFDSILKGYLRMSFGLDSSLRLGGTEADSLSGRMLSIAVKGDYEGGDGTKLEGTVYISFAFIPQDHGGPAFLIGLDGDGKIEPKINDTLTMPMELEAGSTFIRIGTNAGVSGNATNGSVALSLKRKAGTTAKRTVMGSPTGSRFELGNFELKVKGSASGLEAKAKFEESAIYIVPNDGFMKSFMEGSTKIAFELGLVFAYDAKNGFRVTLDGGSGFSVALPMHKQLGPLRLQLLYVQLRSMQNPTGVFAEISMAFSVILGPLTIAVDRMGMKFGGSEKAPIPPATQPEWSADISGQPPKGIGIRVEASVVKGGGFLFLDHENGQYAGALELNILDKIQVGAIGIITTKGIPQASGQLADGFSMVIILTISFDPGFDIGFGFKLTGLGGLLGLHRTINTDKMLESVRNNAIDSILFPENIVANAANIIRQIQDIFPPRQDQFIIGLMARISYGAKGFVDIQFGIALEFSKPWKLAILGVLKVNVGSEEKGVLKLQLNFVGIIDFEKKFFAFDASLYDSKIIEILTIEGDMCIRVSWGAEPGFVASVGGFHPSFTVPPALNVPKMKRFTINILGPNPKITVTAYLAITSNTFQFGAKVELKLNAGVFSIEGYLGLDVLFQFNPFRFVAGIKAGVTLKMGGATLFSLELEIELSGPTPWNAKGFVSFKILFFSFKISFDVTWGDTVPTTSDVGVQVLPLVHDSAQDNKNWVTELPAERIDLVVLKELPAENDKIIMQPFGSLKISQNLLPLDLPINKFGNEKPLDIQKVDFSEVRIGGKAMQTDRVNDRFAPSLFNEFNDDQKLKSPSFENYKSGVKVSETDAITTNYASNRPVGYETIVSDFDPNPQVMPNLKTFDMNLFQAMTAGGLVGTSELSRDKARKAFKNDKAVRLKEEKYVIVDADNLTKFAPAAPAQNEAQAQNALETILAAQPHLRNKLTVVPEYHLV